MTAPPLAPPTAELVSVAKSRANHTMPQDAINPLSFGNLLSIDRTGKTILQRVLLGIDVTLIWTLVLSILAGNAPGSLIGPAYGASVALAKTETLLSETPAEEDNWAAAALWADSLGADVITSSLSYKDWYAYEDMDGNTAVITM